LPLTRARIAADASWMNRKTGYRPPFGIFIRLGGMAWLTCGVRHGGPGRRGPCTSLWAMSSRHILTAPAWPYANGPRHIGHVSGFGLPCDMFSRYQRMAGNKVLMVSGTDEHGTPIQVQADAEGVTARELADRYNRVIVQDLAGLNMSYDLFTRTTTGNHYAVTQDI